MCPKKQHSALWHLGCSILAVVWLCLGRVSITPHCRHHVLAWASHPIMGITSHHGGRGSPQGLQWLGGDKQCGSSSQFN